MNPENYRNLLSTRHQNNPHWPVFSKRFATHFPVLLERFQQLYGEEAQATQVMTQLVDTLFQFSAQRPDSLQQLDEQRLQQPDWYLSHRMMGAVLYVDLFAGDLQGVRQKLPYLQSLGITYLHLMPLFVCPENSDGGYAISDFRQVDPALGTMQQLAELAGEMRAMGMSLVLDFVFNHTSDEHAWAQAAIHGDPEKQGYYYLFPDRVQPDQYERHLREIFPEQAPGNFTWHKELQQWVWTTFNTFQWDLNYSNPAVFKAVLQEMLFLANQGVEVLRLDAVAFIWKQLGTPCENLPQAHQIIQAYNAALQIVAPAMLFKSEAIVHPDHVGEYIDRGESQLSYNPTLMACIWEALATHEVKLLRRSMQKRHAISPGCAWVNYVRVHDDIGWSFADEDAAEVGIEGFAHRQFLNQFYTGEFPGSFAKGVPFNYNPLTQDMRICGSAASLAGLQQALENGGLTQQQQALQRLLLIHSIILSVGGIPLLYSGDELALLNNQDYQQDPLKAGDSRWIHRSMFPWGKAEQCQQPQQSRTPWGYLYQRLQHLIHLRQQIPALGGSHCEFYDSNNEHVLLYWRPPVNPEQAPGVLCIANFSAHAQSIPAHHLALKQGSTLWQNQVDGENMNPVHAVKLRPYQFMWMMPW